LDLIGTQCDVTKNRVARFSLEQSLCRVISSLLTIAFEHLGQKVKRDELSATVVVQNDKAVWSCLTFSWQEDRRPV